MSNTPATSIDLFTISDQEYRYEQYRELRSQGAVMHLEEPDSFVVMRYEEVKAVLGDADTFISSDGVGFNPIANEGLKGATIMTDSPEHELLRSIVASKLQPREVRSKREEVTLLAQELVARTVGVGPIDGVKDFARAMPMSVIPDFLGFPERNREHLIDWTTGTLDLMGPDSDRTPHNLEMARCLGEFAVELAVNRELTPGSLGAAVLQAADDGIIDAGRCPALMIDYLGPSMETTATAIAHLLVLFAHHPQQWDELRKEPGMVSSVINEVLRVESPFRGFTRVAARDVEIAGVAIPKGARVWPIVASANRDELKWEHPEQFDFRRNPVDHLAFGYGVHGCAGQGMARLEIHAIVHSLLESVERIELLGEPVIEQNTWINAWERVPLQFVPAAVG